MGRNLHRSYKYLSVLLVLCLLAGCNRAVGGKSSIGIISTSVDGQVDAETAPISFEQQVGYDLGLQKSENRLAISKTGEGNLKDDVQTSIRFLVENQQVVAIIGSTTNEATMRTASLVNFFNVPMVIPTADGENLTPSNNLWVFRLSAPSSAYANYLFGDVLVESTQVSAESDGDVAVISQNPKVAIVYEQNTFGENAAVAAAHAAMDLSIEVAFYQSFEPGDVDAAHVKALAKDVTESAPSLVFVVCSDPGQAKNISAALKKSFGSGLAPLIVGLEGGFASEEFLTSKEAEGVYVIRQVLDSTNCPVEVNSIYKAQSYAAVFILDEAIRQAKESSTKSRFLSRLSNPETDQLAAQREKVRDVLKETIFTVPCIGTVSFDNIGQNQQAHLELLLVEDGKANIASVEAFRNKIDQMSKLEIEVITE